MQIDFGSLSFNCLNYTTDNKTNKKIVRGNPAWTTAVSKQSGDYKYNAQSGRLQEFQPILIGMVYSSIPVDSINISIGKGGKKEDEHEFILASKFTKSIVSLYINRELVENKIDYPFLMLLTKAIAADRVHCGTQTLRFGDTISLKDHSVSNEMFFQRIREKFGMGEKASWVIEEITVEDQDTIHLYGVVVDRNNPSPIYENAAIRKSVIKSLRPDYPTSKSKIDLSINTLIEDFAPVEPSTENTYLEDEEYSYIAAIKTKPFLILGGFSGTGKSQKVKELAFATCPCDGVLNVSETSPGNYLLVSVKPNWHDATDITGFRSSVNRNYYVTDFMRFLVKAKLYEEQKVPFFVCLDEMNLAPVEEYFADFLSVIESRKKKTDGRIVTDAIVSASVFNDKDYADDFNIFLKLGLTPTKEVKDITDFTAEIKKNGNESDFFVESWLIDELKHNGLTIPSNLITIGTVNMDDTTNSFSRKVIDRAMTFETVVGTFKEDYFENDVALNYIKNPRNGELFISEEVRATEMLNEGRFTLTKKEQTAILGFINGINDDLEGSPFKISYRILNETILLYRSKKRISEIMEAEGGFEEGVEFDTDLNTIFDEILMQKVLPRIEGDYEKCNKCLTKLSIRAEDNDWLKSSEKIEFMIKRFGTDKSGFTTFWN